MRWTHEAIAFAKGLFRPVVNPWRHEIRRIWYLARYFPHISFLESPCEIADDVHIEGHVSIARQCSLFNASLNGKVILKPNVRIVDSELHGPTVINAQTVIEASKIFSYSYVATRSSIFNTTIGSFCSIGSEVMTGLPTHLMSGISTSPIFFSSLGQCGETWRDNCEIEEMLPAEIGPDVWIGNRALIKGGVNIGVGAVIGAGAVVVKDVPPYAVAGGVPAKIIRYRFSEEVIDRLLQSEWWKYPPEILKGCCHLSGDPIAFINAISNKGGLHERWVS